MTSTQDSLLSTLNQLTSESRNPDTMNMDQLDTHALLAAINKEDAKVAHAVAQAIPYIAKVVNAATDAIKAKGRLFYIGAGTSGRLGILDAVECRPTFSVPDELVQGIIAGGETAIQHAVEGAEDNALQGKLDLQERGFTKQDVLVGISASGRTPYVLGALAYAKEVGATTASITNNPGAPMLAAADIPICAAVGPECLTGSTRMKSGTSQKLILNMISTATMIRLGKTYENLMVDVNATNKKLHARAIRIVMQATHCDEVLAADALLAANNHAKLAILMVLTGKPADEAKALLDQNSGYLRAAAHA